MKGLRISRWLLATVFCCLWLSAAENLIVNGDFKDGKRSWSYSAWTKSPGGMSIQTEDGVTFLRLTNPGETNFSTMVVQSLKLESNTEYRYVFKMRTKDIVPQIAGKVNHGAGIDLSSGGNVFTGATSQWHLVRGTTGWTEYRGVFKTKSLSKGVSFYLTMTLCSGTADFTAIQLYKVQPEPAVPAVPQAAIHLPPPPMSVFPLEFQNSRYRLAQGFPGTLRCTFRGKKPSGPLMLTFELPAGFQIIGGCATCPAVRQGDVWQWQSEEPVVTHGANGRTKYTLALPKQVIDEWNTWNNAYQVFLKATGAPGTQGQGCWHLDGYADMPFQLTILPPLKMPSAPLRHFMLSPTFVPNMTAAPSGIGRAYLDYWRGLSAPQLIYADFWAWHHIEATQRRKMLEGFQVLGEMGGMGSMPRLGFARWKKMSKAASNAAFPLCEPRAEREPNEVLCPTYLINDPQKLIWDDYVPTMLKQRCGGEEAEYISFDYEPHPTKHCFCKTCREAFAKFAGVATVPEHQEILKRHSRKWFDFRVWQHVEIVKRYVASCRRHFPGRKIALCTDILHHDGAVISDWCALDVRKCDDIGLDYMMNMPYFEGVRFYDNFTYNRNHLKTPQFPLIDPTEPALRYYRRYTPRGTGLCAIAVAMQGGKGLGFWPTDFFDGAYLREIAQAAEIIGSAEQYYHSGERCDEAISVTPRNSQFQEFSDNGEKFEMAVPDFRPYLRYAVYRLNGKELLTVINYHPDKALILELKPGDPALIPRALANSGAPEGMGPYLVQVEANSAGVWEFAKGTAVPAAAGAVTNRLRAFQDSMASQKKGMADYGMLLPERQALPKLAAAKRSVLLDYTKQAAIYGWRTASSSRNDLLQHGNSRGYIGQLVMPFMAENAIFKPIGKCRLSTGEDGFAFRHVVPAPDDANPDDVHYEGIEVIRRIALTEGGDRISCEWEIVNTSLSKKTLQCFGRIRNVPMLGSLLKPDECVSAFAEVRSGSLSSLSDAPLSTVWTRAGVKAEFTGDANGVWENAPLCYAVNTRGERQSAEFHLDRTCYGVHLWRENNGIMTVEPLYRIDVPYGKKVLLRQEVRYLGIGGAPLASSGRGCVFRDDNGNGRRDAGEPGLAGVRVSDGLSVTTTDAHGHFQMQVSPAARFVFAVRPAGFRPTTPWYRRIYDAAPEFGFKPQADHPLVFYQVTDTEARGPEAWLAEITALGKKDHGDFLLHTGDITGMPVHAERMPDCGMPVYVIPGNHDLEEPDGPASRLAYERHFGPVYYSFDAGNIHFIALTYESNLKDPANQRVWLENELKSLPADKKILVLRHEPPQYSDKCTRTLAESCGKRLIGFICGHTHSLLCRKWPGGFQVWECSPAPAGGLDNSPRAFRVFREENGRIVSHAIYCNPTSPKEQPPQPAADAPAVHLGVPWPMPGLTPARNAVLDGNLTMPLQLKWRSKAPSPSLHCPPVIADGMVFLAASDDDMAENAAVCAFDAATGALRWKQTIGATVKGGLVADDRAIYACCCDGTTHALGLKDGKRLWTRALPEVQLTNGLYGIPAIEKGVLYLYCEAPVMLRCSDGAVLYAGKPTRETGGVWRGGVTLAPQLAISGVTWRQGLVGYDKTNGKMLWRLSRGRDFTYLDAPPVYADGKFFFKGRKVLFAIDPASGKILYESPKDVGMETTSSPAISGKWIVFGSTEDIQGRDAATLRPVWNFRPGVSLLPATAYMRNGHREVAASPVIVGNHVLCGASDGNFYVLELTTGKKCWECPMGAPVLAQAAVSGNLVVVAAMDGTLFAFTSNTK